MSKNKANPISRKSDIVIQEFNNEILIYDLTTHKAFSLNETSALIWQECDGNKTVDEISNQVSRKLKSPVNKDFVWLALDQLKKENLIENESELSSPFEGISRREVIRKVGLATIAALPIVASLVAPTAANAQSGCGASTGRPNGCNCTAASNCSSTCCGATAAGTANQFCVAFNSESVGSYCRANCECANNCCGFGNTCANIASVGTGGSCRVGCECISGTCSGSVCT